LTAKKKAEEERVAKLSAAEQKKVCVDISLRQRWILMIETDRSWTASANVLPENSRARVSGNDHEVGLQSRRRWMTDLPCTHAGYLLIFLKLFINLINQYLRYTKIPQTE